MPFTVVKEDVDIYVLPTQLLQVNKGDEVIIGDLHGNAIKLLFMLFKHGIASGLNDKKYNELVKLHTKKTSELTADDVHHFNTLLDNIIYCARSQTAVLAS